MVKQSPVPMIGRQAFRDAQFERDASKKLELLTHVENNETRFDVFFGVLIVVNLILVGIEMDSTDESNKRVFWVIEILFLVAFIFEFFIRIGMRTVVQKSWCWRQVARVETEPMELVVIADNCKRSKNRSYDDSNSTFARWYWIVLNIVQSETFVRRTWLSFDLAIILFSFFDVVLFRAVNDNPSDNGTPNLTIFRVLRLARIMRTVKLFKYFKDLWLLITGLGKAFGTILWVFALLIITNYLFALVLTTLVTSETRFEDTEVLEWFGKVPKSMYRLFVIMTLESWNDYCEAMMKVNSMYLIIFVVYIMFTHFTVLNLFVGVIVDHVTRLSSTTDVELMREVRMRQQEIFVKLHHVFTEADINHDGTLTIAEFRAVMSQNEEIRTSMVELGILEEELDWLFETLDTDGSGCLTIEEFVDGVLRCKESELARSLMQMQYAILRELRACCKELLHVNGSEPAGHMARARTHRMRNIYGDYTQPSSDNHTPRDDDTQKVALTRPTPPMGVVPSSKNTALVSELTTIIRSELKSIIGSEVELGFAQLRQELRMPPRGS